MLVDFDFLSECVKHNINVMMVGHRGVGKTSIIKQVFSDNGRKLKILSGSNLDPYLEFVGIPKEDGESFKMILPEWLYSGDYDSLFIDEINRARPAIFNALLEIVQFGTMHGKDLGIKTVWVAMNPHDSREKSYHVNALDPALEDRFPVKIDIPYELNSDYLIDKFPALGRVAIEFWENCNENQQLDFSPRQLEEVLKIYQLGLPIQYSVPKSINSTALSALLLQAEPTKDILHRFVAKNDLKGLEAFLRNDNNYNNALSVLKNDDNKHLLAVCVPLLGIERLISLLHDKTYGDFIYNAANSNISAFSFQDLEELAKINSAFCKLRDIKKDGCFINQYLNEHPNIRYNIPKILGDVQKVTYSELLNMLSTTSYSPDYKLHAIAGFIRHDTKLCLDRNIFLNLLQQYEEIISSLPLDAISRNISLLHNIIISYAAGHNIVLDRCRYLMQENNKLVILDSLFTEDSQKLLDEL